MIYFQDKVLTIRSMEKSDCQVFYDTYLSYGYHPCLNTYENYYLQQQNNQREVYIAVYKQEIVGICTLVYNPQEGSYKNMNIAEIVDLSVFKHVRNLGIGSKLMDVAELQAKKVNNQVCLAVGLHSGYGAAQRLYVKRGYVPDGKGAWYNGEVLPQYVSCVNDDDLLIYMSKRL